MQNNCIIIIKTQKEHKDIRNNPNYVLKNPRYRKWKKKMIIYKMSNKKKQNMWSEDAK